MGDHDIHVGTKTTISVDGRTEGDGTWRGSGELDNPPWSDIGDWIGKTFVPLPDQITKLPLESVFVAVTRPPQGKDSYQVVLTLAFTLGDTSTTLRLGVDSHTANAGGRFTATVELYLTGKDDAQYTFTGTLEIDKVLSLDLRWTMLDNGVPVLDLARALGLDVDSVDLPAAAITGAAVRYTSGDQQTPFSLAASFTATGIHAAAALSG
ncbi:hypothetical protein ACFCXR_23830 [Streptomyces noursei]|uniref:hypothetical protein n=1 Tax=Streptomyces noursei TaxID=1971 RepID=UPI0035E2D0C4